MPATLRSVVAAALLSVLGAACATSTATGAASDSSPVVVAPPSLPSGTATSTPSPTPAPSPSTTPGPATPDLAAASVALEPVADLDAPIALTARPDDPGLYIAERAGRVVRIDDARTDPTPVLDMSERTTSDAERGLLGLAFSPDGDTLYVSYTDRAGDSQLDAYEMDGDVARAGSRRAILTVPQPFSNHNGGAVVTGPDGLLYLGLGDGGSAGDPEGNGQDRSTLLGGILRIDPTGGAPYAVPADNPFVGGDGRDELWVYGLRNPWRFSFDAATGDLWIGDVGQGAAEEVDRLAFAEASGANLGWAVFEGTRRFSAGAASGAVPPVFEYPHDGRCSITGGYVYRGTAIPALSGAYVFGDFCDGVVRALAVSDGAVTDDRALDVSVPALVSFGEDRDGELYVLSLDGTVHRIVPG